jgi:hypothetical protein
MINATSTPRPAAVAAGHEQLTLLSTPSTPARFRLSRDTRERGLRHVAEIRAMLAERLQADETGADSTVRTLPARHDRAA